MATSIFHVICLLLCFDVKADDLPPLSKDVLHNSFVGRPACVFFKHTATPPDCEDLLSNFLKSSVGKKYSDWIVGSVSLEDIAEISPPPILYPTIVPSLQCDIGLPVPLEFIFQDRSYQSLKKWFKFVAKKHLKQPRVVTLSNLENAFLNNAKGIPILLVPGTEYFEYMEEIMLKVNKQKFDIPSTILISRPGTQDDGELQEWFGVKKLPAVLFFTHAVWVKKKSFAYMLHGVQEIQPYSIELISKIVNTDAAFLDESTFRSEILDTKYQLPPKLVCVFSHSNPNSLKYISRFHEMKTQLECEGVELEFRLMNIGERNNSKVFARYVNATSIKTFPVFVLFWQEITPTYEILTRQEVLDGIPSTDQVYSFLVENKILHSQSDGKSSGECFSEEDERSLECINPFHPRGFCRTNLTTMNVVYEDHYTSWQNDSRERERKLWYSRSYAKKEKIGNLTVLTDDDWPAVVEASLFFPKKLYFQEDISPTFNLVVFMIKACRYCEIVMPSLEKLAKSINLIDRAAMYLVNCSSTPTICNRYDVRGYPSIKLFRSVPWFEVDGCLTDHYNKHYIVQDFHGPFEPYKLILEWLSNSSLPVVRKDYLLQVVPEKLNHDVYLVATVITKSYALRFLPPSTHNKWYNFKCFQTACELLFGKAICYATMTRDFGVNADMANVKNKDMFVIQLTLFRRDGVNAKIFELGVPLQKTLASEKDSEVHKFHNAHRYSLHRNFRCEDSQALCTEFIVNYVSDHCRLPVTRMSHDGFHTVKRFMNDDDNPSYNLPIAVVLAHQQNLTSNSSYFQEITKAAYELYRDVVFTTLDVDEYPWWASRFVPKDYHSEFLGSADGMSNPPLYHYPRMCVVVATDHHKAAFFPSLKTMSNAENVPKLLQSITAKDIVQFVRLYLVKPGDLEVKTEEF